MDIGVSHCNTLRLRELQKFNLAIKNEVVWNFSSKTK